MKQVTKTTGAVEWYTPAMYIEAAREVLGGIDLDPASCEAAQATVKARSWYGIDDDGLTQDWRARTVFCNPPYARGIISDFTRKLLWHKERGDISEWIFLTNSAADTEWFHQLFIAADRVCLVRGRIGFISADNPDGKKKPPLGQAFFYGGDKVADFERVFSQFGILAKAVRGE